MCWCRWAKHQPNIIRTTSLPPGFLLPWLQYQTHVGDVQSSFLRFSHAFYPVCSNWITRFIHVDCTYPEYCRCWVNWDVQFAPMKRAASTIRYFLIQVVRIRLSSDKNSPPKNILLSGWKLHWMSSLLPKKCRAQSAIRLRKVWVLKGTCLELGVSIDKRDSKLIFYRNMTRKRLDNKERKKALTQTPLRFGSFLQVTTPLGSHSRRWAAGVDRKLFYQSLPFK